MDFTWRNDGNMFYNTQVHRYILTKTGVRNMMSTDVKESLDTSSSLNPSMLDAEFLNRCSLKLYQEIYKRCTHKKDVEYILATEPEYRDEMQEALLLMVDYFLNPSEDLMTMVTDAVTILVGQPIPGISRPLTALDRITNLNHEELKTSGVY